MNRAALVVLCVLAGVGALSAQQPAGKPPAPPDENVLNLPYREAAQLYGGRLVYAEGVARAGRDDHFGLQGLAITQPVVVSLLPKDPAGRLVFTAGKWDPKTHATRTETGTQGVASLAFRAQGEARIVVTSLGTTPSPYQLMVWVGPELRKPMRSPFKSATPDTLKAKKGGDQ